ncbi:DMT family transporter [Breznakia sp. OttesenSCG-928-G09]|nr:DMT family transporter [Breznakia sp. OttesenSCG-928-G09]
MEKKATISLVLTTILWGLGFIFVDQALSAGWQPFPLLMMRGFIGGAFMFFLSFKKKWYKNKTTLTLGITNGVLFFLGFAFQTTGQELSSIPNTAFITTLNVLFVPFISRIFLKRHIQNKIYFAGILALLGTAVLSFNESLSFHTGDILLILCALFFALQIIYNEKCGAHGDPLSITCIQLLTMGTLSLICMPIFQQTTIPNNGWESVLYLALFSSAIASLLQLYGQTHVEPSRASLILTMEAVIGTLASTFILSQPLELSTILGGALMLSAVLIVEYKRPTFAT